MSANLLTRVPVILTVPGFEVQKALWEDLAMKADDATLTVVLDPADKAVKTLSQLTEVPSAVQSVSADGLTVTLAAEAAPQPETPAKAATKRLTEQETDFAGRERRE